MLSREWRCSSSSAESDAPTTFEWSTILLPTKVWLILEVWQYFLYLSLSCLTYWSQDKMVCSLVEERIFKSKFLYENCIWIQILLNFGPMCSFSNMLELVRIMAWHQTSDKPLSKPMVVYPPIYPSPSPVNAILMEYGLTKYLLQKGSMWDENKRIGLGSYLKIYRHNKRHW